MYISLPLGIGVDVLVRAVVCLDGLVESDDDKVAALDCGDYRVTVNLSCLRRRDFEVIGVEPVCLVAKSLVGPLGAHGHASLDGIGIQIIIRPLEKVIENAVTPREPLVNQPLTQTDVRAIGRHELALALQGLVVRRLQEARPIVGRTEAMCTALSVMPQEDIDDVGIPRTAYSDRGRRFRELDVEPNPRMFKPDRLDCCWGTHTPLGSQAVALDRPASEPSEFAAATMLAPKQTGAAAASGTQPFTFETGSQLTVGRELSKAAAKLSTPGLFIEPVDVVRPGDRLHKLDELLGVEGMRRAQPKPAAAVVEAPRVRCAASHHLAGTVAGPRPPYGPKICDTGKGQQHCPALLGIIGAGGCRRFVYSRAASTANAAVEE